MPSCYTSTLYRLFSLQVIVIKLNWCLLLQNHLIKVLHLIYAEWSQVLFRKSNSSDLLLLPTDPSRGIIHLPGCFTRADAALGHQIQSLRSFDLLLSSLVLSGVPSTLFSNLWGLKQNDFFFLLWQGNTEIHGLNILGVNITADISVYQLRDWQIQFFSMWTLGVASLCIWILIHKPSSTTVLICPRAACGMSSTLLIPLGGVHQGN